MQYLTIDKNDFSIILNIAKAIAILGILFFHFIMDLGKLPHETDTIVSLLTLPSKAGAQGVFFFFFASGYGLMMSLIHRQEKNDFNVPFLKKRLFKLFPAYLLSIILIISIYLLFNIEPDRISTLGIVSDLLFIRNFSETTIHGLNGNWWFVATVVQLYIIFMFLSYWFVRTNIYKLIAIGFFIDITYKVIVASLNAYGVIAMDAGILNPYTAFFLNFIAIFFLGIATAKYMSQGPINLRFPYLFSYILIIVPIGEYIGYKLALSGTGRIFNDLFFAITYIPLLLVVGLLITRLLSQKITVFFLFISAISYEIYLIHHPMIKLILHLLPNMNIIIILSTVIFITVFIAVLIHKLAKKIRI